MNGTEALELDRITCGLAGLRVRLEQAVSCLNDGYTGAPEKHLQLALGKVDALIFWLDKLREVRP